MFEIYFLCHIILAIILGAILGWQRTHLGKSAGLRTYALVTGGATLFTILSIHAFGTTIAPVAAAIVTGIGFLGAGTILHRENRVEGLTTAAGLWMAAAIGMAVGVGYYILGIGTTIIAFVLLMIDDSGFKHLAKPEEKA
ncbi:MAG: MgtC/SapB family protein [Candidatus Magasanikbacteria bacterium]